VICLKDLTSDGAACLLEVKNVSKFFRYGFFGFMFKALDNVNFSLSNEPRIFTLAGESGSGKSTLAKIILGIHQPDEGRILYKGKDIHHLKGSDAKWLKREIQAVFQDPYATFNPLKRVYHYLHETVKSLMGLTNETEIQNHIDNTLSSVGLRLSDVREKYPHELSGGELQRVAIARALLTNPRLIVADEPVSMLDASLRINILNIFKHIKDNYGISLIYITHDLATAYYISDDIAILYRGTILERGPISIVLNKPFHPYTKILLESLPEPDPKSKSQYMRPIKLSQIEEKEFLMRGCKFALRCPYADKRCKEETPPEIKIDEVIVKCWLYSNR